MKPHLLDSALGKPACGGVSKSGGVGDGKGGDRISSRGSCGGGVGIPLGDEKDNLRAMPSLVDAGAGECGGLDAVSGVDSAPARPLSGLVSG